MNSFRFQETQQVVFLESLGSSLNSRQFGQKVTHSSRSVVSGPNLVVVSIKYTGFIGQLQSSVISIKSRSIGLITKSTRRKFQSYKSKSLRLSEMVNFDQMARNLFIMNLIMITQRHPSLLVSCQKILSLGIPRSCPSFVW